MFQIKVVEETKTRISWSFENLPFMR